MPIAQSHPKARLAEHVRACRAGDQMIFLDLRLSKYIGVGGPQLSGLSAAILGEPAADDAQDFQSNPALVDAWVRRLRREHLLSDGPATEPVRRVPRLPEPTAGLTADDEDRAADFEWRRLVRLWRAAFATGAWLRRHDLADIADRVAALRARQPVLDDSVASGAMRAAAASYARLRPFALTAHDRCLNDSLALVHFLTTQGMFACWVIGVRVHPFGAHSWVQSGDVVLNDLPERVRRYQPILIV